MGGASLGRSFPFYACTHPPILPGVVQENSKQPQQASRLLLPVTASQHREAPAVSGLSQWSTTFEMTSLPSHLHIQTSFTYITIILVHVLRPRPNQKSKYGMLRSNQACTPGTYTTLGAWLFFAVHAFLLLASTAKSPAQVVLDSAQYLDSHVAQKAQGISGCFPISRSMVKLSCVKNMPA